MHPYAFSNIDRQMIQRDERFVRDDLHVAVWGTIWEMRDGVMRERYQVPRIDSYENLITFDPYLTLQISHFVRRQVAVEYPFNEEMNTGEDWDYYLRIWRNERCLKCSRAFHINVRGQQSVGPRAATGKDWRAVVDKMLEDARAEPKIQVA